MVRTLPVSNNDIRLMNGGDNYGRLEVYHDGQWGTVCDDGFEDVEASVVCRQLGYVRGVDVSYGKGSGAILLDDVSCTGSETRMQDCEHKEWGDHDCYHHEDVGVHCYSSDVVNTTDSEGQIRLVGGRDDMLGRVEIYHADQWGTVCDDTFGDAAAHIVCRQLGFHTGVPTIEAKFGPGDGPVWMDDFSCDGDENQLMECDMRFSWGDTDCTHQEDAGVICEIESDRGIEGALRLVGGSVRYGRLEVHHNDTWGTVCDDSFGEVEAQVACAQLGFSGGVARVEAAFGEGSGPVWLDEVQCAGAEETLSDCPHDNWGINNCGHSEDVGLECHGADSTVAGPTQARIIGGADRTSGFLMVLHKGVWGTVCNDGFGQSEVHAACRTLGFDTGYQLSAGTPDYPAHGATVHHPIWLDNLQCPNIRAVLRDCIHNGWGQHNCDHTEDVVIKCQRGGNHIPPAVSTPHPTTNILEVIEDLNAQDGDIRLVNGRTSREGRVEVYYGGSWGTVCDDGWGEREAGVVCRQLGYLDGVAKRRAFYGAGEGDILLDEVVCEGTEDNLSECASEGWNVQNCDHSEDAGVKCY